MSGTADCEVRDDWFLEQDVNAWSSLAYVVAGVVLAVQVARHRLPTAVYALAAVVVAEGVGSVLFHGSAGDLSQFVHDVSLIGALGFVAGWHAGRLVGATDRGSIVGLVAGLVTAGVLWELFEYAIDSLFGFNMMKSGLPDTMGDFIVNTLGAALAALAGVVYLLDRAGRLGAPFDAFIETNRARFRKVFSRRTRG